MMRAADRLPCCALCALRIIFKPPFRFMPRVRCVGVRADQKPGRARSEAEDQRGRVSARTEQRRLFRRFWPVKSGKTAAPEKAQAPPRPAPAGKPGRVKGLATQRRNHLRKATEPETSHPTPMAQTVLFPARFRSQEALRK